MGSEVRCQVYTHLYLSFHRVIITLELYRGDINVNPFLNIFCLVPSDNFPPNFPVLQEKYLHAVYKILFIRFELASRKLTSLPDSTIVLQCALKIFFHRYFPFVCSFSILCTADIQFRREKTNLHFMEKTGSRPRTGDSIRRVSRPQPRTLAIVSTSGWANKYLQTVLEHRGRIVKHKRVVSIAKDGSYA